MNIEQAAQRVVARLARFNRVETGCGLPKLEAADLTWPARIHELHMRVGTLGAARHDMRPTMGDLEAVGACVLATMLAVANAEEIDAAAGEERAA